MAKVFSYSWTQDYYILHLQFDIPDNKGCDVVIIRTNREGKTNLKVENIGDGLKSHRIMVSKLHPSEVSMKVEYPHHVTLNVYQLDDRAYFPTEAYFVG